MRVRWVPAAGATPSSYPMDSMGSSMAHGAGLGASEERPFSYSLQKPGAATMRTPTFLGMVAGSPPIAPPDDRTWGRLTVTLREGINLKPSDLRLDGSMGKSDPYVWLYLAHQKQRTKTVFKELSPKWNEQFTFEGTLGSLTGGRGLELAVNDKDLFTSDDPIGRCVAHERRICTPSCSDPPAQTLLLRPSCSDPPAQTLLFRPSCSDPPVQTLLFRPSCSDPPVQTLLLLLFTTLFTPSCSHLPIGRTSVDLAGFRERCMDPAMLARGRWHIDVDVPLPDTQGNIILNLGWDASGVVDAPPHVDASEHVLPPQPPPGEWLADGVLTVELRRAFGLIAADLNGYSDPCTRTRIHPHGVSAHTQTRPRAQTRPDVERWHERRAAKLDAATRCDAHACRGDAPARLCVPRTRGQTSS
jgi:hypothetical protein